MNALHFSKIKLLSLMWTVVGILCGSQPLFSQVGVSENRYIRVGSLQSLFSAYGSERAWNNVYYEGLVWPADYPLSDNAVIKRAWIACENFTDAQNHPWQNYGVYFAGDAYVDISLFPMELRETAKFVPPTVTVDGINISAVYLRDIDDYDPNQIADRIITNVVNTSMGLTMTRRIYAFSQQYHDNYFIKEFVFTNTGNTDYDPEIELNAPLMGVRIGWGTRYSVSRDGGAFIGDGQVWGKHTWVTRRGEDYPQHAGESITEANPIVEWLRCGFSWAGQSGRNGYDNIGGPNTDGNGRLGSPQHAGTVVLHVDKSASDPSDDPNQPAVLGWHAGDTYPGLGNMQPSDEPRMIALYQMLSGQPYGGLGGTDRMDETYLTSNPDPFTVHNDAGGTNVWICYGPFDLQPGDSIRIVEAEGVSGLNRTLCEEIGRTWQERNSSPYPLPDGTTTTDVNIYKNTWVATGKDSILLTFGHAKRNFDADFQIPQPPLPPILFDVASGGDRITLSWVASPSEGDPGFAGYEIFRGVGTPDTTYQKIASVPPGTTRFEDTTPARQFSYYYYITAINDGSNNTSGETNPIGPLHSSRFYTRTNQPAYLRRKAGTSLEKIRVVPNPYSIAAREFQYPGEPDKITFLDIPAFCTIKIFTERGDLIQTIEHTDGSGDEFWNSITSSRQVVVTGIYLAYFEVTQDYNDPDTGELLYKKGDNTIRKFVIIR